MSDQDISSRIQAELATLASEEATLNHKYKNIYHSGMGTFDLLQNIERVRKRRVMLEDTLMIMEEFV